ncbi:MAG: A24 family peptidase [Lachnospiraceae bacterium]|nr:A24 family peptidase [Lachnospiraceae bacterium]
MKRIFLLVLILIGAVAFDFATDKIPNAYILVSAAILLVQKFVQNQGIDFFGSLFSLIFPVLLLFPVFVLGGMGGGDIKLYALISIVFSPEATLLIILKSLIAGLVIGLFKVIVNRSYKERLCYLYRFFKDLIKGILMKDKDVLENSYMESLDREKLQKGCIHFSLPIAIGVVLSIFGG